MVKAVGNTHSTGKEQFYTPQAEAQRLTDLTVNLILDALSRVWIEPAAGTGSFLKAMGQDGAEDLLAYDIEPRVEGIKRCNFPTETVQPGISTSLTSPAFGGSIVVV